MNGYVMNTSTRWVHVMKRNVGPGGKVSLDDLYDQYGKKHDLKKGNNFVEWLRAVKVKDTNMWKIVYGENQKETINDVVSELRENIQPSVEIEDKLPAANKMAVKDVVMLSVRKGREILPKINDLKLLKYAFQEANQLSGKDSLCNIIRKRIKDLELGR